ncbi:hypothetical protein [Streptomyces botrytidirepellens]|uniref:Uncharacterized protein n=1 Tax=Streptomyces botrytidirepellens TaxID=2486417 RepID=A0A3M8WAE6_9ACTN|nr:hypothetical protein [Streptomyces botrytidirepellens]RNG26490.1 hypothetical protein EEJ42_14735 [Streptomyces botrytidirepellens]
MHSRHTSRYPFAETDIPESVRAALAEAARQEHVSLSFASGWHLQSVLEPALEAEARNLTDPGVAADLARFTTSFVTQALEWHDLRRPLRDPMPGSAYVQMALRLGYGPPAHRPRDDRSTRYWTSSRGPR